MPFQDLVERHRKTGDVIAPNAKQRAVSHRTRLRPGSPQAGGRDIEQIRVERLQLVDAESVAMRMPFCTSVS